MYRNARTQRGVGLFTKPKHAGMVELEGQWENSPWPVRTSKVFAILNSFMERCNDVIELVAATQQFNKIKMATDFEGAGDVNTNEQIVETCDIFSQALNVFNNNVKVKKVSCEICKPIKLPSFLLFCSYGETIIIVIGCL